MELIHNNSCFLNQALFQTKPVSHEEGSPLSQSAIFLIGSAVLTLVYAGYIGIASLKQRVQKAKHLELQQKYLFDDFSVKVAKLDPSSVTKDSFTALVQEGLYLKSNGRSTNTEEYLNLNQQTYQQRHLLLSELLNHANLTSLDCADFKKLLKQNETQEQRHLLQYLRPQEQKELLRVLETPANPKVVQMISEGAWAQLFEEFREEDLSYIFLAAYCQKKIDLEDVSTAMMFYRAWVNAGKDNCHILPISAQNLKAVENLSEDEKAQILNESSDLKPNQAFLILVDHKQLDLWTQQIFKNTFTPERANGFLGLLRIGNIDSPNFIGTFSFGMSKKLFPAITPVMHLTPTIDEMFYHVEKKLSDFALFSPGERPVIHGSKDNLLFAQIHDLFHTWARQKRFIIQDEMMSRVKSIQIDPMVRKQYRAKLSDLNVEYPSFRELPSQEELTCFLLDRIRGEVIDGGYPFTKIATKDFFQVQEQLDQALINIAKGVVNYTFNRNSWLPGSEDESFKLVIKALGLS